MEPKKESAGIYPVNVEQPSLKSLFIEMYFDDQLLSTGTAILAAQNRESRCAVITNRHNVTGRHQETQYDLLSVFQFHSIHKRKSVTLQT